MAPAKPRATGPSSAINASTPIALEIVFGVRAHSRRIADGADPCDAAKGSPSFSIFRCEDRITNRSRCCAAARTYDQSTRAKRSCAVGSAASAAAVLASETELSPTPRRLNHELECALRPRPPE